MTEHFLDNNIRQTATATAVILILSNLPAIRFACHYLAVLCGPYRSSKLPSLVIVPILLQYQTFSRKFYFLFLCTSSEETKLICKSMARFFCVINTNTVIFMLTFSDTWGWCPFLLALEVHKGLADASLNSYTLAPKM